MAATSFISNIIFLIALNPFRSQSNLNDYKLLHQQMSLQISKQKHTENASRKSVGKTIKNQIVATEEGSFHIFPTPLSTINIQRESLNYSQIASYATKGNFSDNMENFEEARYNLATRIMSNGVEVIIAGDKSKSSDKTYDSSQTLSSFYKDELQIAPHQIKKPMTLAPSTLKNQMILLVPNFKEHFALSINTNQFVTKTCLTTYTYRTTYLQDGKTTVESREKVISNIATEERNYPKMNASQSLGVTLTRAPLLAFGVFPTTYSYYYTLYDGESSKILTSDHTVLNTITAPDDYILFLQPSESATPVFDTNTYFNKVFISKTLDDGGVLKIMTNSETLTQVIVTESLPPRSTSVLTSYYALNIDETVSQAFSTKFLPHSNASFLTIDVPTEDDADYNMHIYATKTFLKTFTYVTTTTAIKSSSKEGSLNVQSENGPFSPIRPTSVNYYTQIIENVITEPVPTSLLSPELLTKFRKELKRGKNQRSVVTLATLLGGQTLEITAMQMISSKTFSSQDHNSNSANLHILDTSDIQYLSNTESTISNKVLEKPAPEHRNISKFSDSNAVISEHDSKYESSELKPAVIKIKPEKSNKNLTKVKIDTEASSQLPTNVNNILGSFNLNRFTVLRPVFNAMADLLQSKFVSSANKTEDKNINAFNISSSSKHEYSHENPIYIPVQNSLEQSKKNYILYNTDGTQITEDNNFDIMKLTPPQSLHIQPPEADLTISEDNWMHGKYSTDKNYIQISSKGNKGHNHNQQPLINGGIPIRPGEIITASSDVIVGKPNGIQQPKVYTLQSNRIPLRHVSIEEPSSVLLKNGIYYEQHKQNPYQQTFLVPQNYKYTTLKPPENYDNILRPPPPPSSAFPNKLRPRPSSIGNLTSLQPAGLPNFTPTTTHSMDKSLDSKGVHHKHLPKIQNINNELKSNEIIEIKRMPEIFSTDILPEAKNTQSTNTFSTNQFKSPVPQNQFQLRLSSQYRNTSSNKVFLDTKQRPNEFKYQSKLTIPPFLGSFSVTPFTPNLRPHSNHQRINLQTNVLSHNIAINVPPLTFKKESLSTSVLHGIPSNSGHLVMPHIKIPPNEVEVQVNLTPHHSVSQHHNLLSYLPNIPIGKKPTFEESSVQNKEPSKLYRNSEIMPYQNRQNQNFHSHTHKFPERNTFDIVSKLNTLNIPIENVVKVIKPTAVFKSNYQIRPTIFTAPDSADSWDTEWSKEEFDSENNLKTTDQISAFSFFKNQMLVSQHSNGLNEFNISKPGQSKKTPYPLLNPLTALQVNHLDETSSKNESSYELQSIKKPTLNFAVNHKLQNTKIMNTAEKIGAKQKDADIYLKTVLTPSSTPVLKLDESWKISNISDVYSESYSGLGTSYQNATKYQGKPFAHSLRKSDIQKKVPVQSQRTNVYNNLFVATGEGFKLNNKPSYSSKNISEKLIVAGNFDHTRPVLNNMPASTETNFQNIFNTSKFELPHFDLTSNFNKQNLLATKQVESYKKTTSLTQQPQAPYKSAISKYLPRPTAVVGLNPPPFQHTSIKNRYKTFELTTTQNPPAQSISAKPYLRSNYDPHSFLTLLSFNYKQNWTHSTLNPKETIASTTKIKSSSFATSSNVYLSKSLIHTQIEDRIKQTTALLPELRRTSDSYLTVISNSTHSLDPQITIKDFEMKHNSVSRKSSQIILEPSMDFPNQLVTLSNEHIPSTLMSSTPTITFSSVLKHTTSLQDSKGSTLPLEQIVQLTKFITNTVTTTKTTISTTTIKNGREKIHSSVKTTTFHLTTTFTTTVVDTVTETHTLIEPTRTTYSYSSSNFATTPNKTNTTETTEYSLSNENQNPKSEKQLHKIYNNHNLSSVDRDNIFIVMTNRQGAQNVKTNSDAALLNPNEDYSEQIDLELATRDEDPFLGSEDKINNILLGGVLIATSNNSNIFKTQPVDKELMIPNTSAAQKDGEITKECRPACKTSRNEICKKSGLHHQCVCRPGFARMFPDRPCRPTYTYTMRIVIKRFGDFQLMYNKSLSDNTSKYFRELAAMSHDAIDRMVMQSDFRDVYHGVYIESFSTDNTNHALIANILLQFSDMNDEKRLEDVFNKYLRVNGYNIGQTELYTDKLGAEMITVLDFNECNHPNFHDCSTNAQCYNLKGTYTCSCNDGYIDLSENLVFPGRLCSAEIIGCEKCNFHGQCVPISKTIVKENVVVCECFAWYSGSLCQLNLKILLIALMTVGTILFVILLICILLTCMKHREPKKPALGSVFGGVQNIRPKQSSVIGIRVNAKNGKKATSFLKNCKTDKLVMIMDTSSESSDSSLPYVLKDSIRSKSKQQCNKPAVHNNEKNNCIRLIKEPFKENSLRSHLKTSNSNYYADTGENTMFQTFENFQGAVFSEIEQSDRSLTVMIPRAKYHHSVLPQAKLVHHQLTLERANTNIPQQSSETPNESGNREKKCTMRADNFSAGALVSAGFEVSAVVNENILHPHNKGSKAIAITHNHVLDTNQYDIAKVNELNINKDNECHILNYNVYKSDDSGERQSFGDSMILLTECDKGERDNQTINTNEEANTMAERDIGSTFLLPHTHLYKPERESDVSGLDSM